MILQSDIFRFCCKLTAKYEFYLYSLDRQISKNLNDSGVETRPVKTNGLWCFALLPTVLILYSILLEVSPSYTLVAYISVGLLFYCMLFTLFLSLSCVILKESMYGGCIASSLISTLLMYVILGKGLAFSLLFSLPTVFAYSVLLRTVLLKCPKTFTIGEAMVVTQAVTLFIVMIIANTIYGIETEDKELYLVNVIVYTVLMTVGLLIAALYVMPDDMRNMTNLGYIVMGGVAFLLLVIQVMLGIPYVVKYIFKDETRTYILGFWLSLVCMSIIVLLLRTKLAVKADTVARKTFHILGSLVFLSGILHDLWLIKLAAGVGLGALIFIEALRKSGIEPIASALQSAFLIYCDEKDCGAFAVTPVYLFAGLACPLALVPGAGGAAPRRLELLSGVLALGVGDTAASWLGSRYGHSKWPGGTRTLEGTAFNILSQVATVYALEMFDLLSTRNTVVRAVVAATASGLVEARTDQVDNLILPLVTIVAFQSTLFLS